MRTVRQILNWFEYRLHLKQTVVPLLLHPVPRNVGWWYVFGSATLLLFAIQVVTGITLALFYTNSAAHAYDTLNYINDALPLGWLLRAVHFYGSSAMVVMMAIHMTRVFLSAAHKYPRELTWVTGVLLMFCTLGMAFSGQVLRWDADAYWGVGVATAIAGRVPWIGAAVVRLIQGGPTIGGSTLARFFVLHVFVISSLLMLVVSVHLYLIITLGISRLPGPDDQAGPDSYADEQKQLHDHGKPFVPDVTFHDALFGGLVIVVVLALAIILGPKGPGAPPDPTLINVEPRPDWPFLAMFALAALLPPFLEDAFLLGLVPVVLTVLLLVPFVSGRGPRHPRRRPIAILSVLSLYLVYGVLTWEGVRAPWSPHMRAWSGTAVPAAMVKELTPKELAGAVVFQFKTCRNCHVIDGQGGLRGPDLTNVAVRLNRDALIRQVIQGGGNMPAYRQRLSPPEIDTLVAFLRTLHPEGQSPVSGASSAEPVNPTGKGSQGAGNESRY